MLGYFDKEIRFMEEESDQNLASMSKASLFVARVRSYFTKDFTSRGLLLLFAFTVIAGIAVKSIANDSLTMGYDDYRLPAKAGVDLNALQKELLKSGGSLAAGQETIPRGESCTEETR